MSDRSTILVSACIACTVYLSLHTRTLWRLYRYQGETMARQYREFERAIRQRDREYERRLRARRP